MLEQLKESVAFIRDVIETAPKYGVVLGTGLGSFIDHVAVRHVIPYTDIPHFPVSTVESHSGKLIVGNVKGKEIIAMQGRFHFYEGYTMKEVTYPIRVMKLLGVDKLFVSNAAGALNPSYQISELMIIEDHINLFPENPLTGKNLDMMGPRFPDMSEPYDESLIAQALTVAANHKIPIHQGVYVGVPGPNLETKAEYKYLRMIGADAVGMSTIPEIIVARHMHLPCFAISVLTDLCYPGKIKKVAVEEVIAAAKKAEPHLTVILQQLIENQE